MTKRMHEVYTLDLRAAELEGKKKLFSNWLATKEKDEDVQARWRAIATWLENDKLVDAFSGDTGILKTTVYNWAVGENPPSAEVCLTYISRLIKKIDDELTEIKTKRERLLNPPEKKSKADEEFPLPGQKIVSFKRLESIPAETPITELEGYHSLPARARDCLKNDNITTAEALTRPDRRSDTWQKHFLRTPNLGEKSLGAIYHFMVNNGFEPTLAE